MFDERVIQWRLKPYRTTEIKVLLVEDIASAAERIFADAGFQVTVLRGAVGEEELARQLRTVHALGIRSKTRLTASLLKQASCLMVVGCFCIGSDQVDLEAAALRGIPVFNSPFSNSRSVAELVIGQMIALARQTGDHNKEMHAGQWRKNAAGRHELRGKTLGIIGYGHIGSQVSVLAEGLGMRVVFHDILPTMAIGGAVSLASIEEVLASAHFVTVHVPETPETVGLIGRDRIALMRAGAYLINDSRGKVVDLDAVVEALRCGHLAGLAADVYPAEPSANGPFRSTLQGLANVVLSPHIGGSTEEAQQAIGAEVATAMTRFIYDGSTIHALNVPAVDLRIPLAPANGLGCRLLNVHRNVPGVLGRINRILEPYNIDKQACESHGAIGYLIADVSVGLEESLQHIYEAVFALEESLATRILFYGQ